MEKERLELYEIAKNAVNIMMRKVIEEEPKLIDKEDIRVQTALQLSLKLTDKAKNSKTLPDKVEKAIEYTMQVFNKAFAEVYELYIEELRAENQEETEEQIPTKEEQREQEDLGEER